MSRQPRQTLRSWQAYFNGSSWHPWQMAKDLLAFSADGPWQSWQMAEDLLAFSTDGPGFLGIWSRISRQMAKNLSIATSFPSHEKNKHQLTFSIQNQHNIRKSHDQVKVSFFFEGNMN